VSPDHWVTAFKLGQALRAAGRCSEALGALSQAHDLNPKSISPLVHRAECRATLGEIDLAMDDLRAALEREPGARRIRERLTQLTSQRSPAGPPTD
jgi:regulator of sirC expression with transglutaminase-like and TPR domain